jgi:hypothetical protein
MKLASVALAAAALSSGCAAPYVPPTEGPRATLVAKRGTNNLMAGGSQFVTTFKDESCDTKLAFIGSFSWASKEPKAQIIPADSRVYVRAGTDGMRSGFMVSCTNVVSFIPRDGATYEVSQELPSNQCRIQLIDTSLGTSPPSMLPHEATFKCRVN